MASSWYEVIDSLSVKCMGAICLPMAGSIVYTFPFLRKALTSMSFANHVESHVCSSSFTTSIPGILNSQLNT